MKTETMSKITAELLRLGLASALGREGLDVVMDLTRRGWVRLADSEAIDLPAAAALAALRSVEEGVDAWEDAWQALTAAEEELEDTD